VWTVGLGTGLTVSQRRRVAAVRPSPSQRLLFLAVCCRRQAQAQAVAAPLRQVELSPPRLVDRYLLWTEIPSAPPRASCLGFLRFSRLGSCLRTLLRDN
jgi:hypothetical protein